MFNREFTWKSKVPPFFILSQYKCYFMTGRQSQTAMDQLKKYQNYITVLWIQVDRLLNQSLYESFVLLQMLKISLEMEHLKTKE